MRGKAITAITLAAFVLASASCMMWRTKAIDGISGVPGKHARVMSVVLASGERVDFSNSDPGRVRGLVIEGTAAARYSVPIEVPGPVRLIKKRADGSVFEITDGSGRVHAVQGVSHEGDAKWSILVNDRTPQRISIPLSEVRQVRYRKINPTLTFIAITAPLGTGLFFLAMTAALRE